MTRRSGFSMVSVAVPVAVAVAAMLVISACSADPEEQVEADLVSVVIADRLSSGHQEGPVAYETSPPLGGDHAGIWQDCGFYTSPILDETAVHSMEHGAVWLAYEPSLDDPGLEEFAGNHRLVIAPYPGLNGPLVATAWGAQIALTGSDDPRLDLFLAEFTDRDVAPEPGGPCTGGFAGTAQDAREAGFGQ